MVPDVNRNATLYERMEQLFPDDYYTGGEWMVSRMFWCDLGGKSLTRNLWRNWK